MTCWQTLGIAPTSDEAAIKKAYAARIREHRPDRDPEGFRAVRTAYEEALAQCAYIRPRHEKKRKRQREADAPAEAIPKPPPQNPPDSTYYGYTATLPPQVSETLRAPENVAYLERPQENRREMAPHDYLDRPADNPESPAARLARWRTAWENAADDAALLAVLQTQATEAALYNIDVQADYRDALYQYFWQHDNLLRSYLWASKHYHLPENESQNDREQIARYLDDCRAAWEQLASDHKLLAVLQAQAADPALQNTILRQRYLAALREYLTSSAVYPISYYWAKAYYHGEGFGKKDPHRYSDYPERRLRHFCDQLDRATDDAALLAVLQQQQEDPLLIYPPFRADYAHALATRLPAWADCPQSLAWAQAHHTLPTLSVEQQQAALLARLQAAWDGLGDDNLLAVLQQQAARYHDHLQHIDLRIDYLAALRQHLASRDHLPRSTIWAGEQYQLHHSHDAEYRRRYLAARVALKQPPEFTRSPRYAALADWLQQSPWRRRLALWRDWTVSREHPAHRQWETLYHDLAAQLRSASAPGLDRQLLYRRSLLVATSLALAGIASLGGNTAGVVQILLVLFYNIYLATSDFPEYDLAKYHLYRSSPPLRTLDHAYHPLPYGAYWLLADLAVIARTLTVPEPPWTGFAALWFILRFFQTLWSLKRAVLVGWQPQDVPDAAQPLMTTAIQLACLGLWLPRALNGEAMPLLYAITALLGIGLYGLCWLRLPAERMAQCRTMLDLAPAVLIPPLAFLGDSDPYYSAGALLLAPLLALALYYQYSPRWRDVLPLAAFAIAVETTAVLYLGASLHRLGVWSAAHGIGYLPVFVLGVLLALHYLAWLLQGFADDEPLRG